jgi:PD-(D/E)XK nuclease superfamily
MFTPLGDDATNLADRIKDVVNNRSANAPRSQQKRIGLSEVGEICVRKTSYKLLDWAKTNPATDPWASISGTAIHAWLADAFMDFPDQYLVEHKVQVTDELSGTADLFDIANKTVIDHKCVGATAMKSRKKDGMTHQQRIQINLYGLGFERQGHAVEKVALAFYPLGGRLDGLHTIVEPYNRQLALDAIERLEDTQVLLWQLDPEANPKNWDLIPTTPSRACSYCPWFLPYSKDGSKGCPGEAEAA